MPILVGPHVESGDLGVVNILLPLTQQGCRHVIQGVAPQFLVSLDQFVGIGLHASVELSPQYTRGPVGLGREGPGLQQGLDTQEPPQLRKFVPDAQGLGPFQQIPNVEPSRVVTGHHVGVGTPEETSPGQQKGSLVVERVDVGTRDR